MSPAPTLSNKMEELTVRVEFYRGNTLVHRHQGMARMPLEWREGNPDNWLVVSEGCLMGRWQWVPVITYLEPKEEKAIAEKKEKIVDLARRMGTEEDGWDFANAIAVAGAELVELEKENGNARS